MDLYRYEFLHGPPAFRVLHLHGPLLDGPVEAELFNTDLGSCPDYEALSYTWEGQSPSVPVSINGKVLLVTDNCEKALRRLLRGRLNRTVWVDSICINQGSLPERSHQVSLMAEIYRRASRVNVWLGPSTEATDAAMSALKKATILTVVALLPVQDTGGQSELTYGPLGSIFSRSWFRRMWVVQEVAMARDNKVMLYCGDRMILFQNLITALDYSEIPGMRPSEGVWRSQLALAGMLKESVAAKDAGKPKPNNLTLSTILIMATWKEATNAKDKVYGIYGVARYLGWELPEPDYEKSLQQIYTEAGRCAIQQDRSLELLSSLPGSLSHHGLPSWAPDLSDLPASAFLHYNSFSAGGTSALDCSFSADGRKLTLRGNFVDLIEVFSSSVKWNMQNTVYKGSRPTSAMFEDLFRTLREWTCFARQLSTYPTGEAVNHAFARTLFIDCYGAGKRDTARLLQLFPNFYSVLLQDKNQPNFADGSTFPILDPTAEDAYTNSAEFRTMTEYTLVNIGRRLLLTAAGMLGTAPASARVGDVVVIFAGSKVPSILREQEHGFLYIGPAYIHGAMDGELCAVTSAKLQKYILI